MLKVDANWDYLWPNFDLITNLEPSIILLYFWLKHEALLRLVPYIMGPAYREALEKFQNANTKSEQ